VPLRHTVPLYLLILSTLILSSIQLSRFLARGRGPSGACAPQGFRSDGSDLRLVRRDGNRTS
jgi:hypothetical protein